MFTEGAQNEGDIRNIEQVQHDNGQVSDWRGLGGIETRGRSSVHHEKGFGSFLYCITYYVLCL